MHSWNVSSLPETLPPALYRPACSIRCGSSSAFPRNTGNHPPPIPATGNETAEGETHTLPCAHPPSWWPGWHPLLRGTTSFRPGSYGCTFHCPAHTAAWLRRLRSQPPATHALRCPPTGSRTGRSAAGRCPGYSWLCQTPSKAQQVTDSHTPRSPPGRLCRGDSFPHNIPG